MANVSSSNGLEKYLKLRFKGFSEPWEHIKLSDFVSRVTRKNSDNQTDIPLTISSKDGLINQNEFFSKQVASKDMSGYYLLQRGEFAYNKSYSVGFDFGSIKRLEKYGHGALSTLYICFALDRFDSDFIKHYFDSLKWYREIYMISAEGARNHGLLNVPTEDFFATLHTLPMDTAEQRKIAEFLDLLTTKIEKQHALVDNLKKYKRGIIKEFLTPQTCPIKNAVWNEAPIGELGTFVKGAPLSKADISDEGTPFILYGELYTTYGEVINKVVRRTQKNVDNVYLSRIGDVLIPTSGETPEEISTASCVMVSGVILAGDLNIFRTSKVDGRIMSYVLNHIVNGNIARIAQGKSVVHIQASEISKISISYPDKNTQQQLITVFDGISEKIALAEESLAKMIMLKKSLIQKMFI